MKAETLKKLLQAGALATDAMSRGSAGGLGAAIVNSKIDLSGKDGGKGPNNKTDSGASNGAVDIHPTEEQDTEDVAGKRFGGQGNKRRNKNNYSE